MGVKRKFWRRWWGRLHSDMNATEELCTWTRLKGFYVMCLTKTVTSKR